MYVYMCAYVHCCAEIIDEVVFLVQSSAEFFQIDKYRTISSSAFWNMGKRENYLKKKTEFKVYKKLYSKVSLE